ncbi:MAG: TolC family protein [Bacteroidaceae bacterium]|nr:TolC family protein [Bacteroidaceae bacterium]
MNLKMRLKTVVAILAASVLTANAQDTTPTMHITLDKAIELALSENPTIKIAEKEIELKEVSKSEAWQNLLPTVTLDGAIVYNAKVAGMKVDMGDGVTRELKMGKDDSNTWNGALQVAIPLYAPAVYETMKLSNNDVELAVEKSRGSKIDMINQVTKAYYQLMLAQDSYNVLNENFKLAETNFNIVNKMFEQGLVSEYDKISAEVQKNNAWPSVISGKNAVELARLQLKVLMGITADVKLIVDDNLANYENEMSKVANAEIDLTNNSSLRQIDMQTGMISRQRKMLKTSFIPTLALVGSYQVQSISNTNWNIAKYSWSDAASVTLSLSIPIFKAKNFSSLKSNKVQLFQLAETRINTERMLKMQAQSFIDNMTTSSEQLSSNKEAVRLAEKGLEISQKRYDIGNGTILELTNSQVQLTNTRLSYNNTIYDYLVAKSELNKVMGKE